MNINVPICALDGTPFEDKATVKSLLVYAAISSLPRDEERPIDYKITLYGLARRLHEAEAEIDLTADEVVLLKERVGRMFNALVIGRVLEVIDPATLR